jgi:hypothetical protein
MPIKRAAESIGIKYGTAKTLMNIFRKTGRFERSVKVKNTYRYRMSKQGKIRRNKDHKSESVDHNILISSQSLSEVIPEN